MFSNFYNVSSNSQQKTEYVLTIFHHNEDFQYFIDYYIPQINYIKKKIDNDNNIGLNIYIFTSVDITNEDNIKLLSNSVDFKSSDNDPNLIHK